MDILNKEAFSIGPGASPGQRRMTDSANRGESELALRM